MNKLTYQLRYLIELVKRKRFRKLYNYLWVYPFWLNYGLRTFLITKIFPLIKYDPFPYFLEIEPTTICPLKCTMCEHTYWNEEGKNLKFSDFKMTVDQFPRLKWLGLTGIGESFSNPDYVKMVEYISTTSRPIIELVDNFYLMNEERARRLIDCGVDIFFISMCGATKETSDKIMGNSDFNIVVKNIKNFVRIKRELNSFTPILNFHYILSKKNIHEALDYLDFIKSLNANEWEVLYTPLLHGFKEIKQAELTKEEISDIMPKIKEKGKEIGIRVHFNECVNIHRPISSCSNWIMPFIFVTGEVIPCCSMNEANNRERQKELSMGTVFSTSFKDIWYGQKYTEFRKLIRCNKTPAYCIGCPVYTTNNN